jgi:1-phosphatidylinositol-3-phosphate 5-kinase
MSTDLSESTLFLLPKNTVLTQAAYSHIDNLLTQVLEEAGIVDKIAWNREITRLVLQVVQNVRPNPGDGDEIDIRHYVKIKKLPGGNIRDSTYLYGVAFSKHLVHKKFLEPIENPKILLLKFGIEYERVHHFVSLESLMSQEDEARLFVSYRFSLLVLSR